MDPTRRRALWVRVLELSKAQGADSFSIDTRTWQPHVGHREARALEDIISMPVDKDGLRRLHGVDSELATVGPDVLSVNLYGRDGWVAGISDSGDGLSVLFEDEVWHLFEAELAAEMPPPSYEVVEAVDRPTPPRRVRRLRG